MLIALRCVPHTHTCSIKGTTHNGIVGARNRGAQEAAHDVIVFLDSHSEVTPGWLPPLVSRIHGDRTRVVIPALHPIGLDTLRVSGYGNGWSVGFNLAVHCAL